MNRNTLNFLIILLFLMPISVLESRESDKVKIPVLTERKSYSFSDSLLQLWNYEFQDTRLKNLRPHLFLDESGKLFIFSRKGFFAFDRHNLYELPKKSLFPGSDINYSLLDSNNWLWLISNNFDPYRPVFNIQFFNLDTYEQKSLDEFLGDQIFGAQIHSLYQLSSGEIIFSSSDNLIFLYDKKNLQLLDVDDEWVLKGITARDEMILWNTVEEQFALKKIDSGDEYELLTQYDFKKRVKECYVKEDYLLCLTGSELDEGIYTLSLSSDSRMWNYYSFPENIRFSYNPNHQHYIYSNDLNDFYQLSSNGIERFPLLETLVDNIKFLQPPNFIKSNQNFIFPTYEGISIGRVEDKKVCTALVDEFPVRLSSRGLKFLSENQLWVNSYSGLHILNYDLEKCSIETEKLNYSCSPRYTHNTILLPGGDKKLKYSKWISVVDRQTGNCTSIDINSHALTAIWNILPLSKEWYLFAAFKGLYISDLNSITPLAVLPGSSLNKSMKELPDFQNIEFFRLQFSADSNHIFATSSNGVFILQYQDGTPNELSDWTISEWLLPGMVIRDVMELDNGQLLIASQNDGMIWLSEDESRVILGKYNTSNALRNNFSHNILKDELNRIWLSTNHGLYIIDLEKNIWRMLGQFNGFSDNEFNYLSATESEGGLFAFGGINGVAIFDPLDFQIECTESYFYLTSVHDADGAVNRDNIQIEVKEEFSVNINTNVENLEFDFSGTAIDRFYCFYIRKAGSRDWVKINTDRTISTHYLSQGNHQYEIAGSLENGKLVINQQDININLQEGGWSPLWFVPLVFILPFLFLRLKNKGKKKQQTTIENESEAEVDIEEKEIVEEEIQTFQPLQSPNTFIFKEHQELKEVKNLNEFLSKFREKEILPIGIEEENIDFIDSLKKNVLESMNDENFSVELLAQLQTVSYRQLHRLLKEKAGLSPNKFISLIRIIEGRRILTEGWSKNVKEVNYQIGYNKPSHFSSLFKDVYGINPKKYQMQVAEFMEKIEEAIEKKDLDKSKKGD